MKIKQMESKVVAKMEQFFGFENGKDFTVSSVDLGLGGGYTEITILVDDWVPVVTGGIIVLPMIEGVGQVKQDEFNGKPGLYVEYA